VPFLYPFLPINNGWVCSRRESVPRLLEDAFLILDRDPSRNPCFKEISQDVESLQSTVQASNLKATNAFQLAFSSADDSKCDKKLEMADSATIPEGINTDQYWIGIA
jgi:hypothetical protein